jgi:hypothetical protein
VTELVRMDRALELAGAWVAEAEAEWDAEVETDLEPALEVTASALPAELQPRIRPEPHASMCHVRSAVQKWSGSRHARA